MTENKRKKKTQHLKTSIDGSTMSVQFLNEWVKITLRLPRRHLTKRLLGRSWQHLERLELNPPRRFQQKLK